MKSKIWLIKSRDVLTMLIFLDCLCVFTPKSWARYSGGTGEPNDPYRIATAEDLNDIGNYEEDWDKHFILINDVNLAQYTGTQFKIIGNRTTGFTGVFDGNNHKILSFMWKSFDRDGIGLFAYIGYSGIDYIGQVKNLGMENVNVNAVGGYGVSGLVGYNYGTVSNCYSTGSVTRGEKYVGGLVGHNYGNVSNCYSSGSVTGGYESGCLGGLVGDNDGGTISNCFSTGSVSNGEHLGGLVGWNGDGIISNSSSNSSVSGVGDVGGLVGFNVGMIMNCYSIGSVTGEEDLGGLVGHNSDSISNCYSTGSVIAKGYSRYVGGLAGFNYGAISNCYSSGSVTARTGDEVGGLVGRNWEGTISNSFWDVNTSGWTTSDGGTGKTTTEMKTKSTFTDAGWDFVEIWGIGEHQTYPYFLTGPTGDFNYDKEVNFIDLAILSSHWLEEK